MKRLALPFTMLLIAGSAWAGGTTIKTSVVPIVDTCDGTCLLSGDACATNDDCAFGSLSEKSKLSLAGSGRLKAKLKGIVDASGIAASGEYILQVLTAAVPSGGGNLTVKVAVEGGNAKVDVELGALIGPEGQGVLLHPTGLRVPPDVPEDCPGDNSIEAIAARMNDLDCTTGPPIGLAGITVGSSKTSVKSNAVPVMGPCTFSSCGANPDFACATNADCNFGSFSPKSKLSLKGDGKLKLVLKKIVDAAGMDAAGEYILGLAYVSPTLGTVMLPIKVTADGGKAKTSVDLASLLGPATSADAILGALYAAPLVPMDCPGTNSPDDIAARTDDDDCTTGPLIGVIGVTSGD